MKKNTTPNKIKAKLGDSFSSKIDEFVYSHADEVGQLAIVRPENVGDEPPDHLVHYAARRGPVRLAVGRRKFQSLVARRWRVGALEELRIFRVRHLVSPEKEAIDPDAVHGTFTVKPLCMPHLKPAFRDADQRWRQLNGGPWHW